MNKFTDSTQLSELVAYLDSDVAGSCEGGKYREARYGNKRAMVSLRWNMLRVELLRRGYWEAMCETPLVTVNSDPSMTIADALADRAAGRAAWLRQFGETISA